jgi:hypothetical protein
MNIESATIRNTDAIMEIVPESEAGWKLRTTFGIHSPGSCTLNPARPGSRLRW